MATTARKTSRFELAPPRHFILPAVLLLLSERPAHGYSLMPRLQALRCGHVDRPAVYRALAQLEGDGLVEASPENAKAGQARRVYRVTGAGDRVLRGWMGVIKEEHDHLGHVLRRYQATGTTDAALAEIEGGWSCALGVGWSSVSPSAAPRHRLVPVDGGWDVPAEAVREDGASADGRNGEAQPWCFRLLPDRSVVLVDVRSTVGPLSFGAIGVCGWVRAAVVGGAVRTDTPPSGQIEIDICALSSGNSLYDAELRRRIDARRFPKATVDLRTCTASRPGGRYRLEGTLTFHGVTRPAAGTVNVDATSDRRLVVTGEQVFDIRDFAVTSPTVLMLRIYPDVRVRLHAEAELDGAGLDGAGLDGAGLEKEGRQ